MQASGKIVTVADKEVTRLNIYPIMLTPVIPLYMAAIYIERAVRNNNSIFEVENN